MTEPDQSEPDQSEPSPTRVVAVIPALGGPDQDPQLDLFPVRGRPVLDRLIDRVRLAEAGLVRVVTRDDRPELIAHLQPLGVEVLLTAPAGDLAAIGLGITGCGPDDVVLIGIPERWWEPTNGFVRLVAALTADPLRQAALGLFQTPEQMQHDEVVVEADEMGLTVVSVRPGPPTPVSDITWGCAVARASALSDLGGLGTIGELWHRLATDRPGSVVGLHLGRDYLDVGTAEGRERARA
jgi:hypothetical protein